MSDELLTMIPGPTPVRAGILEALSRPTVSHVAPAFQQTYKRCLANLRQIALGASAQPFVVAGSGTLAMEMALVNLVAPGEKLLVVSQGYFGDRWVELARSFDVDCEVLRSEWGRAVQPEAIQAALAREAFRAVAMTHVDTSTGAAAPIAEYCDLLRGRDELRIVDGVCATAGIEERFDDWKLDVLLTGAQKALGAPPGVAILLASARALDRRRERSSVPAFVADLLRWLPIMENPGLYFSTPPVNEIVALAEATDMVLAEGVERRFARHATIAVAMRAGLAALGLSLFTEEDCRADTLSVVRYPETVDDGTFRAAMAQRKVIVAAGLGPIAGKTFRIGHMGNIGGHETRRTLEAIEASLIESGVETPPGLAVQAADARLSDL